jgi:hypothetical protein
MNEISAHRIAQAIAAMKAIDAAWNVDPNGAMASRLMTDLAIARIDLESALLPVKLTLKEAA